MSGLLHYLKENQDHILADVERVVKAESPTQDKQAVDRCGEVFQSLFAEHLGLTAEVIPMDTTGNHLRFTYGDGDGQILILGHMDTVWDIGRLSYRVEGNKAYGPGILDMKSGIIQAIWAVKACKDLGVAVQKKVVFLCTSDEETGSDSSRAYIEAEARKSDVVLVVEPAVANSGALKTSRKGVGHFTMSIKGKASHAGNHHEEGISAVEEMAHQILFLQGLTDYSKGTTINVGIASGGNRTNVVAESALLDIDVRINRLSEAERISDLITHAIPFLEGTTLQITGNVNRPPMERTAQTERLFHLATECGNELGMTLTEAHVGGGSDGNFTAALGVPTLDGLGAMGDGPHAEYEHILIDQLPVRAALLASLMTRL
ncbi:M20 family metallopeptidase [Brevibacillus nitrificans]|uniref:M20 family metallopeptidase n=1 Tax=Brevibacillus nitrificans TaxID=651560 RepID=UPI00261C4E5C|nr:M20 family metallopeptidase [Brevibacillus nitrificans]